MLHLTLQKDEEKLRKSILRSQGLNLTVTSTSVNIFT